MKPAKSLTRSFLVEIGTEELPSDALRVIRGELKSRMDHWLNEKNLLLEAPLRNLLEAEDSLQDIRVEVTPRRIVIFIEGLPVKQPDREDEVIGPSVQAALTPNNEPTPALLGFLKSKGATLDDIFKKTGPRGEAVAIRVKKRGVATEQLLKTFVPDVFSGFQFPKTMKWNVGVNFPRPIRWILALWGPQVLPFEFAGLKSGRLTYGHRFLAPLAISVKQADYREIEGKLKKAHVTLSFEGRTQMIRTELAKQNPEEKIDRELIEMSASLTEDPAFIRGGFDKRFLKLPEKILATSMKKHQKIFALYEKSGSLRPNFLAVVNGRKKKPILIQKNYENVLEAKLKDAEFFYQEDRKTKLEAKLDSLRKVTFLGKLGTLFEKTERMMALAEELSEELKLSAEDALLLERAAQLSKTDLVTHMVYEFPELQGFAGSEYARLEGETPAVANALKDHYLPISGQTEDPLELEGTSKDEVCRTRLTGALLAIVDKLDTLVGAMGMGLEISGSQDPYALRRAANGIVLTVFELKKRGLADLSFSLKKLIARAILLYGDKIKLSLNEITPKLKKLFEERILWVLGTDRVRDKEFLAGIFNTSSDNLLEVWKKFSFLKSLESQEPTLFRQTHKIVERTRNILKGVKGPLPQDPVNTELFQSEEERALFAGFSQIKDDFNRLAASGATLEATKLYASVLYDRISQFFDRVLVNVEDEVLKRNRLALLRDINALYTQQIADLSPLTQMA